MIFKKETLVTSFALFSMFFGAGNLILPPLLGFQAGNDWILVTLGFGISAVLLPLLGIIAHARLQGTLMDFSKKISPYFGLIYGIVVYLICIALPAPRTASVTHEMAIQPFFDVSSLLTSVIYFSLVFVFALNRSKVLDLLGQFLTPLILLILLTIIGIAIVQPHPEMISPVIKTPVVTGLLEGYQTFDAVAAMVVGGVLIVSIHMNHQGTYHEKKKLVTQSGILAGIALLLIYAGFIYTGAVFNSSFPENSSRTALLAGISTETLGSIGNAFLSVLVALACFTTAIGIVTGTADFVKGLAGNSQTAYVLTALLSSLLGVIMGQFDVQYIIAVAVPALMLVYPVTILLIVLNVIPNKFASSIVFKSVVVVAILFSLLDFGLSIGIQQLQVLQEAIPFGVSGLGWVLPSFLTFVVANYFALRKVPSV
ncbi:branched-chain amino acid transport system II carrier protein [Imtechella halotolerans]|uniref:Branched-chain amino acid transport system carrier protein n=1 Tax=Imtechella halotolerans K1 TaxID=946077 RepID=I0WJY5_9FLAO|nr:branched-chain amino acid transport system II carrier protein [Imtechella halotolerans]EID76701.1 branched-chain amino acid transport system carrier protein [Imtechella halotolerans K1]WMQ62731.1 branched-chain amino acid transport system II carrier protein [Imtechella halotolerans]